MKAALALALPLVAAAVRAVPAQVDASSFGFDPADATRCLQAAIDSGAAKVVVDRQASDWIVRPIRLRSGQEIVFARNVVVRAMPGAFTNRNDSLFLAENVRDVVLRGEGRAVLKMRKADYDDKTRYAHSEWRHVLTLRRARNVRVLDLALESSGGDGIYVDKCEDVTVERVSARDNYRQGMSVIGVKGLVVRDSRFCDTSGAASGPWAGIDFEPNEPGESITSVLVENCEFTGNRGGGFDANLSRFTSNSKPVDITVRNCRISGNRLMGVGIVASQSSPVGGRIMFENCSVAGGERHVVGVVGKSAGSLVVTFRDCAFDGRSSAAGAAIAFRNRRFQTFGSVHFERSRVFLGEGQRALDYAALPENGMEDVTGTLAVTRADGAREELSLEGFAAKRPPDPVLKAFHPRRGEIASLRPVNPDAKQKPRSGYLWFRDLFSFAQYVPAAGEYPVSIRMTAVGRNSLQALVEVFGPDGKPVDRFRARGEETTYAIKASGEGVYVMRLNSFGHAITVDSPWPGQGVLADEPVPIIGGRRNGAPYSFSFVVPEGAKEVVAQIMPDGPGEAAQAQLVGPDGVAATGELKGEGHLVRAVRANPQAREIWTLRLPVVKEDCRFAIASPCLPAAAFEPEFALDKPQGGL